MHGQLILFVIIQANTPYLIIFVLVETIYRGLLLKAGKDAIASTRLRLRSKPSPEGAAFGYLLNHEANQK